MMMSHASQKLHNADCAISSHVIRYCYNLLFMMRLCQKTLPNVMDVCLKRVSSYYQSPFINPKIHIPDGYTRIPGEGGGGT